MKTFTDAAGRTITLAITIGAVKRLLGSELSIDLLKLEDGSPPLLTRLSTDLILLVDTVYVLCKPELDKLGITDEQFGQSLSGDTVAVLRKIFFEELTDFFRRLQREHLVTAINQQLALEVRIIDQTTKHLNSQALQDQVQKQLDSIFETATSGTSSINSQG